MLTNRICANPDCRAEFQPRKGQKCCSPECRRADYKRRDYFGQYYDQHSETMIASQAKYNKKTLQFRRKYLKSTQCPKCSEPGQLYKTTQTNTKTGTECITYFISHSRSQRVDGKIHHTSLRFCNFGKKQPVEDQEIPQPDQKVKA